MNDQAYAGVNTTIALLEDQFLSQSDYQALVKAQDLTHVKSLLTQHGYTVSLEQLETRDYDAFLMGRLKASYQAFYQEAPDGRVVDLFTLRYAYHNLKVLFKSAYSDLSKALIDIGPYPLADLKAAIHRDPSDLSDCLAPSMVRAIRDVLEAKDKHSDPSYISVILDRAFLYHRLDLAASLDSPELVAYVVQNVDFENLSNLFRGLSQGRDRAFLQSVLCSRGSFPLKEMIDAGRSGELAWFDRQAPYPLDLAGHWRVGLDLVTLDGYLEKVQDEGLRATHLEAFGPLPLVRYLHFLEAETKNIRYLLTGRDYQVPIDQLMERLGGYDVI